MAIQQIHIKNLIGERNRFLDLTPLKVRFNFDHLFHIPKTIRSLVFFPYHIDVSQVDKLNKYCKENDYTVEFIGGESFYGGGDGPFTNGTMTILLLHKDDEKNINFPHYKLVENVGLDPQQYQNAS
ncbi:MAG: hypothetical protein HOD60_02110 [Candidatus Nitrosopelagicus sp.]|nr:hypothetical protein [Candidatus Nitrosopelagicus sp.]